MLTDYPRPWILSGEVHTLTIADGTGK